MTKNDLEWLKMTSNDYIQYKTKKLSVTDRPTDWWTDRPTDGAGWRVACTRLKTYEEVRLTSQGCAYQSVISLFGLLTIIHIMPFSSRPLFMFIYFFPFYSFAFNGWTWRVIGNLGRHRNFAMRLNERIFKKKKPNSILNMNENFFQIGKWLKK